MDESDDGDGGINGRTIALGVLAAFGVLLVVRALRGGDEAAEEDAGFEFGDDESDAGSEDASDDTDDGGLAVDAVDAEGVSDRFDEIDVVDAVYILVAGLKAAREEYRTRTDDGGA
jgi:hypothetical protein